MRYNLESMLPERAFQKKLGGHAPATLEGGGSAPAAPSQPTNQNITTSNIAPWAQSGVSSLIQSAMQNVYPNQTTNPDGSVTLGNQAGYTPFNYNTALNQPTSAQGQALSAAESTTAGFSPLQQQAQQSAYNMQVPGQYNQASNLAGASGIGALGTTGQAGMYGQYGAGLGQQGANIGSSLAQQSQDPNALQNYMNPYLQNSLAPALALQNQQFGQLGAQEQGQATQAGAFGGGREAVMAGLNQQNQMLAQNQLVGNAYNQAYNTAQGQMNTANQAALAGNAQAMQGAGIGLQGVGAQQAGYGQAGAAGTNLAGIGGQQLAAQQGVIGTQATQGALQQQQNQNTLNQAMTNYNTAQTMPMTQLGQLESLYTGAPQNITSTGYTAAPSTVSQVAGLGGAAIAGAKLAGMKRGGLAKTKNFDVGGSVEYKLRGLAETDPAAFIKQVALTTSPEEKKIERQVAIDEGIAIKKGGKIFENMASGGIVAFAEGGTKDDAVEQMGKYETPDQATLNQFYADKGIAAPVVTNNQQTPDRMALASNMQDAGQAYLNATKNSTVDPKTQGLWRLLQGGLDVAGQTGPNALTNIAKGSQAAVAGAMQDVSEQKKAAMQRAQSEYDVSKFDTSTLMEIAKNANEDRNKELDRLMRKGLSEIQANATIEASLNVLKGHQAQAAATGANTEELGKTRLLAEQTKALDRYQDNVLNVAKSLIPSNKSWDTVTTAERKNAYNEATKMVEKPDFSSTNKGNNTEPPPPFGHELDNQ